MTTNGRYHAPPADGVWLCYTEDWSKIVAFDSPVEASDYAEQNPDMLWAWAPWGQWFGKGCVVVDGLVGGP